MPIIPIIQDGEVGESQFKASPVKKLVIPYLKK
jgi:hypothetical protein